MSSSILSRDLAATYLFDDLPKLSNYTLEELWYEWTAEVKIHGQSLPPLRALERRRACEGYHYRPRSNKKCKMQVFRRKWICEYVENKLRSGLSIDDALTEIRAEMHRVYGKKWTLNKLVVWLAKKRRTERGFTRYYTLHSRPVQ